MFQINKNKKKITDRSEMFNLQSEQFTTQHGNESYFKIRCNKLISSNFKVSKPQSGVLECQGCYFGSRIDNI